MNLDDVGYAQLTSKLLHPAAAQIARCSCLPQASSKGAPALSGLEEQAHVLQGLQPAERMVLDAFTSIGRVPAQCCHYKVLNIHCLSQKKQACFGMGCKLSPQDTGRTIAHSKIDIELTITAPLKAYSISVQGRIGG
jgi:hypothetical protein